MLRLSEGVEDPGFFSIEFANAVRQGVHMTKKTEKLYEMIDDIETAMFTTRRRDGHLVSRPMATQARAKGADLWFVTYEGAAKLAEINRDPHVNLAYYKDRTREWISVSGIARVVENRKKIKELYRPDWRAWFGTEEGDDAAGTPDDPRIVLIGIDIDSAFYMEVNKPQPIVLLEVVRGMVTGKRPDIGKTQRVSKTEVRQASSRAKAGAAKKSSAKTSASKKSKAANRAKK